jgi:hypothetical protein
MPYKACQHHINASAGGVGLLGHKANGRTYNFEARIRVEPGIRAVLAELLC